MRLRQFSIDLDLLIGDKGVEVRETTERGSVVLSENDIVEKKTRDGIG